MSSTWKSFCVQIGQCQGPYVKATQTKLAKPTFARRTLVCSALCILNSSSKTSENHACNSTVRSMVPQEHLSPKAARGTSRKSFLTKSYWVIAPRVPCPLLRPEQPPGFWTGAVGARLGWAAWAAAHLLIGTRLFSRCVPFSHFLDLLHTHCVLFSS